MSTPLLVRDGSHKLDLRQHIAPGPSSVISLYAIMLSSVKSWFGSVATRLSQVLFI